MGERRVVIQIFKNFWESIQPRQITGNLIGKDNFGNTYYEIPADPKRGKRRPSRWFTPKVEEAFDQEMAPEWESWLRFRRQEPPSVEEVAKNFEVMQLKKKNALELEKKYKAEGGKSLDVPKPATGYESFPKYDDLEKTPGEFGEKMPQYRPK